MKHRLLLIPLFVSVAATVSWAARPESPHRPFVSGENGAYYSGRYVSLFGELLGKSESEVGQKLARAFDQLFFGNDSTERVYYADEPDSTMAYIEDIGNGDVRTEGMSYGMMIAVQMNRKDVFDKLWKWAKVHMQIQSGPHKGYFAWHCRTDGSVLDSNAASDGEEWFVMSLFFASGRWGNGTGIFNYEKEANEILNTMLHKEEQAGRGRVTNMFDSKAKLVVFVPVLGACEFTDPSYQVPHYYELWSRWGERDNEFWKDAAAASRRLLQNAANPKTGLCPDYSHFDGKPVQSWPGGHSDFRFDAWRVAMNVAMDHEWFGEKKQEARSQKQEAGGQTAEAGEQKLVVRSEAQETYAGSRLSWEVTECNRLLSFFAGQGIGTYGNQYTLDGKQLGKDHSTGLVAMNAVAALASTNENRKAFVEELWNVSVPSGFYRYYDGMLYMLGLLQVSGNFRIYSPAGR